MIRMVSPRKVKRTIKIPRAVRPMQNNRVSSALCPSSVEIRCFGVVKGGFRFGEIDAVLRNVRSFFLGIPLKSHYPLHIGAVWDDVNIELQYNLMGIWLYTWERAPRVPAIANF